MSSRNLLAISDLDATEIQNILAIAKALSSSLKKKDTVPLLRGKTVVNLFYENSTRTRISFELATRKLEGAVLNFAVSGSSVAKGESLLDTAQTLKALRPDCFVLRHSSSGAPKWLASELELPVINAGDGFHEHPTQALLDAFSIQEKIGSIEGKRVLLIGDILHSRVARSNIRLLKKLGASVILSGPPTLLPPFSKGDVEFSFCLDDVIAEADVIIALRIQKERHGAMQFPSVSEYARFWGLSKARIGKLRKNAIILHPGPVNRGVELAPEIMNSSQSIIQDQVFNGLAVRMAVLARACNPNGLQEWLRREGHLV